MNECLLITGRLPLFPCLFRASRRASGRLLELEEVSTQHDLASNRLVLGKETFEVCCFFLSVPWRFFLIVHHC